MVIILSNFKYFNKELGTSFEKMSIAEYSPLLKDKVQGKVVVLLIQVGVTLLYVKEIGMDKLEIIVGEVRLIRVWMRWPRKRLKKNSS